MKPILTGSLMGSLILGHAWQVYPTLVIRGTGLYELWKKGLYRNYDPVQLVDLVARILSLVPPWVRIYRIQVRSHLPSRTPSATVPHLGQCACAGNLS